MARRYLEMSPRRHLLDKDLNRTKFLMNGLVLDVGGGRKLGTFERPVKEGIIWRTVDIQPGSNADIICDAHNLYPIKDNAIDTILAIELIEHCREPQKVINEFHRVLKQGSHLILSMPFLMRIHKDPTDYSRLTDLGIQELLKDKFEIIELKRQGLFFTVMTHQLRDLIKHQKLSLYLLMPCIELLAKLDNFEFVKKSKVLSEYTTGFFVVAKKI